MKIELGKLVYGVNRPQSWWDGKPQYVAMQTKLIDDIRNRGLQDPLLVSELPDGYWRVEQGNQRLKALNSMEEYTPTSLIECNLFSGKMKPSSANWDPDKVFAHLIPVIPYVYDGYEQDGYYYKYNSEQDAYQSTWIGFGP